MSETPTILDASGRPARPTRAKVDPRLCPRCGRGPKERVASSGFGVAHPVCGKCGHEWVDEVFRG